MKKFIGASSIGLLLIIIMGNAYGQLAPELAPSEQACENLEISNRLYNPVTITLGYDKATLRTPEVIVSKSNPDAVVPINILEQNASIFTNATGRFVAKLDLQYASPSEQPRLVTYNIISGKQNLEFERGTWFVDGKGFCKVITFVVSEEPHIPTIDEQLAMAKEVTAVELKANREEQMKTNDIMTMIGISLVGLICAILIGKVISILMTRHDVLTVKRLLAQLKETRTLLIDAKTAFLNSVNHNDILNESQRHELESKIKEIDRFLQRTDKNIDDSLKTHALMIDQTLRNNKQNEQTVVQPEIKVEQPVIVDVPLEKKKLFDQEFPKFVKDGLSFIEKSIDNIPSNPITNKLLKKDQSKEPETFEEWFEFYNKIDSREELLKIFTENQKELRNDLSNKLVRAKCDASYKVLILRQ